MPTIPPTSSPAYDSWTSVLNAARFRLSQKMPSLTAYSGNILGVTQASTQQACINGFRRLQDVMVDGGAKRYEAEIIIEGIPAVSASQDPAQQSAISQSGCFDGDNWQTTPALPPELILPLWMAERQTGVNACFPPPSRPNMPFMVDGLPMRPKMCRNGCAEWRGEAIYYPGSTFSMDFRIRFRSYLSDPADDGTTRWFQTPVPIIRCQDPLAWWVVREFAIGRASDPGEVDKTAMMNLAASCEAQAMSATKLLVNKDVGQDQRLNVRRIPYGNGAGSGRMWR